MKNEKIEFSANEEIKDLFKIIALFLGSMFFVYFLLGCFLSVVLVIRSYL